MDPMEPQATGMETAAFGPKGFRAQRRPLVIAVLTLVMVGVVWGAYLCLAPLPRVPQGILTATSDDSDPSAYRQEGAISDAPTVSGTATKLESQRNVTAVSSQSTSGGAQLLDATITIFNLDNDLVMRRVGLAVFEQLRDQRRFQQVRYVPAGDQLPVAERLPDLFVILDKENWKETVVPSGRRFQGKVIVRASNQYQSSNNVYHSSSSPPRVQFRWHAEIDYSARQTGVETSGARYEAVSRDLGQEITKQLTKQLDDLRKKHRSASHIPDPFYPQYVPPPEFDFLEDLGARKLIDGSQFMLPTVALWQTSGERTPAEVTAAVRRGLVDQGWPDGDRDGGHSERYLRSVKGSEVVTVFANDGPFVVADDQRDAPRPMMIQYVRDLPASELDAAVEAMFSEENPPETTLLMFQQFWYRHQDLVEAHFEKFPPLQSDSWLQLARFRQNSRPEEARQALRRAHALRQIVEQEAPDTSMRQLAEELGMESLSTTISPELINVLGFHELDQPSEMVLTARIDEPVVFWLGGESEEQVWLILTPLLGPARTVDPRLRIQVLKLTEGSRSLSEHESGSHRQTGISAYTSSSGQRVEVAFTLSDDKRSVELTILRMDPASPRDEVAEL